MMHERNLKVFVSFSCLAFAIFIFGNTAFAAKIKSVQGEVTVRVAGSGWYPAHVGADIDPSTDIKVPNGGKIEIFNGKSTQWMLIGEAEASIPKHAKGEPDIDIDLAAGILIIAYSPTDPKALFNIKTSEGTVQLNEGVFGLDSGTGKQFRLAVDDGRACIKRQQSKTICTDEKNMMVIEPGKPPKNDSIDKDIKSLWKSVDWAAAAAKPDLRVIQPQDGARFSDSAVIVSGSASKDVPVYINNKEIKVKSDGSFSGVVSLFEGENKLVIQARSNNGKTTSVSKTVYLDSTPPLLSINQ
ncbi:MAG TPA: hypothetical protein PLQ76_03670, partial [bacterium]|nr:hypothetical protein [bacterium]